MNFRWTILIALAAADLFATSAHAALRWTPSGPGGGGALASPSVSATGSTVIIGSDLGGAYRSTDGGISWTVIGAGNRLYSTHVDAVVDHPSLDGTVFLGTDNGVYRSTNCTPAGDCTFTLTRFENSAGKKVNRLVTALGIILVRPTQRPSTRQGLTAGAGGARIFGVRPIMEIPGKKWTRRDFR